MLYLCTDFYPLVCSDHAAEGDATFVGGVVSPQAARVEEPLKVAEEVSPQQLMEELAAVAGRQTELVAQLKTRYVGEGGILAQKDEQIASLKAQLAGAQAEVRAATEHARKVTDEKLTVMSELQHERGELHQFRSNLTWGVRYLEEKNAEHFGHLDDFRKKVEGSLVVQEEKLRSLSIEYDEELYPHLMSMIAERRYLLYIL